MAKRQLTEEQRQELRQRLAKARAARKTNQNKNPQNPIIHGPGPVQASQTEPEGVTLSIDQYKALMERLSKLESQPAVDQHLTQRETVTVNQNGQNIGVIEKYPIDPKYYPNPIEQLLDVFEASPQLRRFGVRDNFELRWEVSGQVYETKFGTNIQEPFFKLTLIRKNYSADGVLDEKGFVWGRLVFNEDKSEAIRIASEMGLALAENDMRYLMDNARFERMKSWLIDKIQGVRIPEQAENLSEQVDPMTGRAMQVLEIKNELL